MSRATMLPGEDGHNCVTRRWHLSWNINLTRFSFTCKHSTQLTIRTAQGTTGPTITECTTHTKLYKKEQIISNYIFMPIYPHHLTLIWFYVTATSKSGQALLCGQALLDSIWNTDVHYPSLQWPVCWLGHKRSGFLQHLCLMLLLSVSCN